MKLANTKQPLIDHNIENSLANMRSVQVQAKGFSIMHNVIAGSLTSNPDCILVGMQAPGLVTIIYMHTSIVLIRT